MTTFDIIVFSILGLSVVLSLFKGLVKEIFSLLSYLGGYLMAAHYQQSFAQVFIEIIPSKAIAKLIAFISMHFSTLNSSLAISSLKIQNNVCVH